MKKNVDVKEFAENMDLRIVSEGFRPGFTLDASDINRPGLQFSGYYSYFAHNRVQVVGMAEMTYIKDQSSEYRQKIFEKYFSYSIPCIILARGFRAPAEMLSCAKEAGVPVLSSRIPTTRIVQRLFHYLNALLAPSITRHGVLLDIYGVGVMFMGDSGIGKSETAMELIKRGHKLVADDVVEITRVTEDRLVGKPPEFSRYLMELRGIGIIDISKMFGIGAVTATKTVDLIIELEMWQDGKMYDRLGLNDEFTEILNVKIPTLLIPVRPGRNLAIIVEVAARNFCLKQLGYNAAEEFDKRINANVEGLLEGDLGE